MKKIIHLLCHTLDNDTTLDYHIKGNWSARQARNILSYSNKYQCEVWYAVRNLKKNVTFKDGDITYRLFQAQTVNPLLESFYSVVNCPSLFAALALENPKTTAIHFQGERGSLLHKVLSEFPAYKVTIQYHGYGQPWWLNWAERLLITPIEKRHFPHVYHFFVHIKQRIHYLTEVLKIDTSKISFQNNGIDFDRFKPLDKKSCRRKLNLAERTFIILYVGAMVKTKGVDKIIKAYKILKKKHDNVYLLFVGATKTDPLYYQAKKTADQVIELTDNKNLPLFYNAADVYVFFGNRKTIDYAGVGTAPTEAMACNLNVISTNLIHLPDEIVLRAGFVPKDFDDFVSKIDFLYQHPKFKFTPRNIVEKYTSYEYTTRRIIEIYDRLFS